MKPIFVILFCSTFVILASFAAAKDFTTSIGKLSDVAFYKSVACKAPSGKSCETPFRRWPKAVQNKLTIGLVSVQAGDADYQLLTKAAISNAVDQINKADTPLKLKIVTGASVRRADIKIYLIKPRGKRGLIRGTGNRLLNGQKAENAIVASSVVGRHIVSAAVAVTVEQVSAGELSAILLEEIVQGLGLSWDIRNPYYAKRSIFAQQGRDFVTTLTGQDLKALQLHYPK